MNNYTPNQLIRDEYGRVHGILAIDKPVGLTSHDVVNQVRHILGTKKVGHAGSLDPFASGVLLVIVGKATALSDELMAGNKSYTGEVLLGISTTSHDPEGEVIANKPRSVSETELTHVLSELQGGYTQDVPVYSSIKVKGQKLRVLARKYHHFVITEGPEARTAEFYNEAGELREAIPLPQHFIEFTRLILSSFGEVGATELISRNQYTKRLQDVLNSQAQWSLAEIVADCPKGTYIRQLAYDIGRKLDPAVPSMLLSLRRTRVGKITADQALPLSEIARL